MQDGKRRGDGHGRQGLHDHAIIRTRHSLDERLIRRLAIQAGYGHSVKVDDMQPGSAGEAEYVSKYVSKSADQRWDVPWRARVVDIETGEVSERLVKARYRTWSASRQWGLTMKQLRAEAAMRAQSRPSGREDAQLVEQRALAVLIATFGIEIGTADEPPPMPS